MGLKNLIKRINGEYEKHFITIKCNSKENLPLNKMLKLHNMTTVIRSVFQEDGKYYPKDFLGECSYNLLIHPI